MKTRHILIGLVIIGAFLRWFNLPESTSFFFDQARDALKATGILNGNFTLIGPTADTSGLFMGPLWYYFLAPLYKISGGNPVLVTALVSLLDLAAIPLFYFVSQLFFNKKVSLVAAAIWATNAHSVAYARTLANPSTTVFWTLIFIYTLKKGNFIFASIIFSILFQFNPATAFLMLPFIALVYWKEIKNKVNPKTQILATGIFLASFTPQLAFELRHQFIGFRNLPLVLRGHGGSVANIINTFQSHFEIWLQGGADYTFPESYILAGATFFLGLWLILKDKKILEKRFFLLWATVPVFTFIFVYLRSESHPHYLLAWVPVLVFLLAYLFVQAKRGGLVLVLFLGAVFLHFNLAGLNREIILKDHIAQPADPNRIGFNDQLRVIDLIYEDAKGNPFGYHAYNITPYWADDNWQYLFNWYGQEKYGYIPERHSGDFIYIIYEPDPFFGDTFQKPWLAKFEEFHYKPLSIQKSGLYQIQKFSRCESACP